MELLVDEDNTLVVRVDDFATEVDLKGGSQVQTVLLKPSDFVNSADERLDDWDGVRLLRFSPAERLRPARNAGGEAKVFGGPWKGQPPTFRRLRWATSESAEVAR